MAIDISPYKLKRHAARGSTGKILISFLWTENYFLPCVHIYLHRSDVHVCMYVWFGARATIAWTNCKLRSGFKLVRHPRELRRSGYTRFKRSIYWLNEQWNATPVGNEINVCLYVPNKNHTSHLTATNRLPGLYTVILDIPTLSRSFSSDCRYFLARFFYIFIKVIFLYRLSK